MMNSEIPKECITNCCESDRNSDISQQSWHLFLSESETEVI